MTVKHQTIFFISLIIGITLYVCWEMVVYGLIPAGVDTLASIAQTHQIRPTTEAEPLIDMSLACLLFIGLTFTWLVRKYEILNTIIIVNLGAVIIFGLTGNISGAVFAFIMLITSLLLKWWYK